MTNISTYLLLYAIMGVNINERIKWLRSEVIRHPDEWRGATETSFAKQDLQCKLHELYYCVRIKEQIKSLVSA